MARVELTRHLFTFFPALQGRSLAFEVNTVAELVAGIAFYICDERGRLRRHVNIFVDEKMVNDRGKLSDPLGNDSQVLIMQALSGG